MSKEKKEKKERKIAWEIKKPLPLAFTRSKKPTRYEAKKPPPPSFSTTSKKDTKKRSWKEDK